MPVPRQGDPLCPTGAVVLVGRRGVLDRRRPGCSWRPGECTWCGRVVPPGRRTLWCSAACSRAYDMTQPERLLRAVFERDAGRCSLCGLDTERMRDTCLRWLAVFGPDRSQPGRVPPSRWHDTGPRPPGYPERPGIRATLAHRLTLRGLPTSDRALTHLMTERRCWWDGDHTIPIVDGGHPCDLANLRTLCYWCHKRETAEAATRRAEARRMERAPEPAPDPVPQLALFGSG